MSTSNVAAMTAAERAMAHSKQAALVFAAPLASDAPEVVDLRALDTPVSDVALKNAVRVAWRRGPLRHWP